MESCDGQTARCARHGGEFQILFTRTPPPAPAPVEPPPIPRQSAVCAYHPTVAAVGTCQLCGTPICGPCDVPRFDGGHLCRNCLGREPAAPLQPPASAEPAAPMKLAAPLKLAVVAAPPIINVTPPVSPFLPGVYCQQHTKVQATSKCKVCGAFMCHTCAFDLPGGAKICPACATAPPKLNSTRKKLLIGSFVSATWCTIASVAVYGGMLRGLAADRETRLILGWLIIGFLPVPSLIGLTLGLSSMERRASTTIGMWIATAWNGLILGIFILRMVLITFNGASR